MSRLATIGVLAGLALGTAANAILLQYSAPLWVYLAGIFWLGEKPDWRSTLAMWLVHLPWLVVPMGGFLGLAARGEGALLNMIVAHYFGRGHYGKISGAMQPFNFVGLGSGPLIASLIFDNARGGFEQFEMAIGQDRRSGEHHERTRTQTNQFHDQQSPKPTIMVRN